VGNPYIDVRDLGLVRYRCLHDADMASSLSLIFIFFVEDEHQKRSWRGMTFNYLHTSQSEKIRGSFSNSEYIFVSHVIRTQSSFIAQVKPLN
jgi:hypothetical protein